MLCVQQGIEMDERVVEQEGRMTAATVEWSSRRRESSKLVAIERQWMTASGPKGALSKF